MTLISLENDCCWTSWFWIQDAAELISFVAWYSNSISINLQPCKSIQFSNHHIYTWKCPSVYPIRNSNFSDIHAHISHIKSHDCRLCKKSYACLEDLASHIEENHSDTDWKVIAGTDMDQTNDDLAIKRLQKIIVDMKPTDEEENDIVEQ